MGYDVTESLCGTAEPISLAPNNGMMKLVLLYGDVTGFF
jgi:hypothetical protein